MNFDDFKPIKVARLNGQVDYQGSTSVLNGCAVRAQHIRYTPDTAGTRYGTLTTMAFQNLQGLDADITGVDTLEVLGLVNPGYRSIAFDSIGELLIEMPDGSGVLVPLVPPFPLPANARMRDSTGDNNMLMAFEDGKDSLSPPIMYRGQTKQVMPVSQNPVGALWQTGTIYLLGDLVRVSDGRWWRCTLSGTSASGSTAPQWPLRNGYFSAVGGFLWTPAIATDSVGGSEWEEWTPACVQYMPAPSTTGAGTIDIPGTGTIPPGQDVYIKVAFVIGSLQSPLSAALVFRNTAANDQIRAGFVSGGNLMGGLPMPRWIAELAFQSEMFNFAPGTFQINVFVAAVATGAPAPVDSAYSWYGKQGGPAPIEVTSIPTNVKYIVTGLCPVTNGPVKGGLSGGTTTFMGQGGSRYMIVLRKDANGSLSPVDPDSPILVNLVGEIEIAIVEIARDISGNVTATVGDITAFTAGQSIQVQGCTGDVTFNGTFLITKVEQTLTPQGVLLWTDSLHLSASNDQTGAVLLPAGPLPTAFLPPGGLFDIQDIAAFTVASPQTGAPNNLNAGPFFYIPEAAPSQPFKTNILSIQGPLTINRIITTIQRFVGGAVTCRLPDITGIAPGMTAIVQGQGDTSVNGSFVIQSVIPAVGLTGDVLWLQPEATAAAGPGGGGLPLIIQQSTIGEVQATVEDASGLSAGYEVQIAGIAAPYGAFNGLVTISSVLGNVVNFPSAATGAVSPGTAIVGTMQLLQNLPTCAPAGPINITSIQQDESGHVTATVDNLGGLAGGQTVQIHGGAQFSTLFADDGWVELTSAVLNPDGLSGTVTWTNPSFATAPNAPFVLNPAPNFWNITAVPDLLINFDDSALSPAVDVTGQLSTTGIYAASDVYFVPSLRQAAYVDNDRYPAAFIFSNEDDPGNIVVSSGDPNNPGSGILVEQGSDSSRAICVREIKDGPIIGLKQKGGYQINPSDTLPSQWNAVQRWKEYGPYCADLVALASNFIAFWDIVKGPFVYTGGALEWIGKELSESSGTLKRVNTKALAQGWAEVDEEALELKFGLPLDGATLPNYELVVNYEGGWGFPEVVNRYGKLIVPRESRKWSINPWNARTAKSVKRVLATQAGGIVPIPPDDPRINNRQFLYGMQGNANPTQSVPLYKTVRKDNLVTFYWSA